MYPLNMILGAGQGFALANDAAEHEALTAFGYAPPFVAVEPAAPADDAVTVEAVRAQLDELGIAYDKRLGLAKLQALLPAA